MRVLNNYAGLGGNRRYWTDCKVVAVENDEKVAAVYHKYFPDDEIIIADAHEYLLRHYKEFDYIWTSPPCQTHSSFRKNICVRFHGTEAEYPDMRLYQEILFLQGYAECGWTVENVKPWYTPLISPTADLQRHLLWANFGIAFREFEKDHIRSAQIPQLQALHGFDLSDSGISNKRQILRNCVNGELGLHVFEQFKLNFDWKTA